MSGFVGSNNSRFFALLEGAELTLLRTGSQTSERNLSMPNPRLIDMGNGGTLFLRSDEGIHVLDNQGREQFLLETYRTSRLSQTSSYLGRIFCNIEGTELCLERITPYTRLSAKIFSFISPAPADKGQTIHEIIFYQPETDKEKIFKFLSSSRAEGAFFWSVSRDFEYLIVGEPFKTGQGHHTHVSLISVSSGTILYEFNVGTTGMKEIAMSCDGTALIDLSTAESPLMWLMSISGDRHIITPPPLAQLLHLGRGVVVLRTERPPAIIVKDFHDKTKYAADLTPLEALGIACEFRFTTRDDIDFITRQGGQHRIVHTHIDRFETDAKRWEMLAQYQQSLEESKQDPEAEVQRLLRMRHYEERTKALASSTEQIAKVRSTEMKPAGEPLPASHPQVLTQPPSQTSEFAASIPPPPLPSPQDAQKRKLESLIDALEERFIMGEMSETSYIELRDKYRAKLNKLL
jgi:hypothetical protein